MTLLFTYVILALAVSFVCSLLEAALLTITPSAVHSAGSQGAGWAPTLTALKADMDRPLAAILTLNTMAHTMGAAGAGAQYAEVYGSGSEALFAAGLTAAVLILSEIIPKTLGTRYACELAPFTALALPAMITALAPLVWFSRQMTRLITLGKSMPVPRLREEVLAVANLGRAAGQLQPGETRFLHNVLQLNQVRTSDIMTPRTVVFSLPMGIDSAEFVRRVEGQPYTRIPLHGDDPDDVRGFVIKGEVLMAHLKLSPEPVPLDQIMRPIARAQRFLSVDKLFQRFLNEHAHIMLVMDEYGTPAGIVTLEDVLETIFGLEIVDELDKIPDLRAYAHTLWQARAERLGIEVSPIEAAPTGEAGRPDEGVSRSGQIT